MPEEHAYGVLNDALTCAEPSTRVAVDQLFAERPERVAAFELRLWLLPFVRANTVHHLENALHWRLRSGPYPAEELRADYDNDLYLFPKDEAAMWQRQGIPAQSAAHLAGVLSGEMCGGPTHARLVANFIQTFPIPLVGDAAQNVARVSIEGLTLLCIHRLSESRRPAAKRKSSYAEVAARFRAA